MSKLKKVILIIGVILILAILMGLIYIKINPKVAVLCYHNVATLEEMQHFPEEADWTISVNNFEEQLQYLSKHNYKTLTLEELRKWKNKEIELPYKSVLITFDDGFLSNYQYAFSLLKKYNMNATVFLIGQYMGKDEQKWDGNIKKYLNLETIAKCKEEYPNIEFASHSYGLHYHNSINEKTEQEIEQDLKKFNEEIVSTKAHAYPFGAKNEKVKKALDKNGYELAFTYGPGKKDYRKASRKDNKFEIPRLNVSHGMNVNKFALRLMMPF